MTDDELPTEAEQYVFPRAIETIVALRKLVEEMRACMVAQTAYCREPLEKEKLLERAAEAARYVEEKG